MVPGGAPPMARRQLASPVLAWPGLGVCACRASGVSSSWIRTLSCWIRASLLGPCFAQSPEPTQSRRELGLRPWTREGALPAAQGSQLRAGGGRRTRSWEGRGKPSRRLLCGRSPRASPVNLPLLFTQRCSHRTTRSHTLPFSRGTCCPGQSRDFIAKDKEGMGRIRQPASSYPELREASELS